MPDNDGNDGKDLWSRMLGWLDKENLPSAADLLGSPDWIEKYVRRTISQAIPASMAPLPAGVKEPSPEVFDTHHFVIVKCKLPRRLKAHELRLFVRPDRVKLDGWPDGPKIVRLPVPVDPRDCRALCRDGLLQIKLRKKQLNRMYHEVDIRFID